MTPQRHTIKQQILELQVGSNIKAFELQNQLSELYRSKIIPLIDAYCNQFSDPDTLIRIDTLDIDLGEIDLQTLETDFVAKVKERLYEQLAEQLGSSTSTPPTDIPSVTRAVAARPDRSPENARSQPPTNPTASQLEIFSYFLRTGLLPWWCDALSPSDLEDCCEQLLRTSPVALKAVLQTQLKYAIPSQRLVNQFSDQTLINLTTLLAPTGSQWLRHYLQDMQTLMPQVESLQGLPTRQLRLKFWQGIWGQLSFNPRPHSNANSAIRDNLLQLATSFQVKVSTFWQQMLSALEHLQTEGVRFESELPTVLSDRPSTTANTSAPFQSAIDNLGNLLSALKDLDNNPPLLSSLRAHIDALWSQLNALRLETSSAFSNRASTQTLLTDIETLVAELETHAPTVYDPLIEQIKAVVPSIERSITSPARSLEVPASPNPFNQSVNSFSESEEIYIQNAGLILLWPFLTRFFETLNLVQANQFIDLQAAERAVLILQYLVNTATEIPEHWLPLNKLLCGLDLSAPVPATLDIAEIEQHECDTLLTAVIQNWSALKSTSIEGFRQTFLRREGILRVYRDDWLLQVEQKTYDILIDQLPWSIRVIKLPWMTQVLYSEW